MRARTALAAGAALSCAVPGAAWAGASGQPVPSNHGGEVEVAPPGGDVIILMRDIVVVGRGLVEQVDDPVIVRPDPGIPVEAALGTIAGLDQFRRSDARTASPTSQGLTLRGLGGNAATRMAVTLDDVPFTDPFGGWVAMPALDAAGVTTVRVARGAGSVTAGPGAVAGVVALEGGELYGGGRGLVEVDHRAGTRLLARTGAVELVDGVALLAGASVARGRGFAPIVAADRGPADGRAPYAQIAGRARVIVNLGGPEAQLGWHGWDDRRERGTAFSAIRTTGQDVSVRLVERGGALPWTALAYRQWRDLATQFAATDAARTVASPTLDQRSVPARGLGGRIEVRPTIGAVTLRLGGDARALKGRTEEGFLFVAGRPTREREAGGRAMEAGLFAEATVDPRRGNDGLIATVGARVDRWRLSDGRRLERAIGGPVLVDERAPDRSGTEVGGSVRAGWQIDAWQLSAGWARAHRLPTLNELHRPFRLGLDVVGANPALEPERVTSWSATIDSGYALDGRIQLTVFRDRLAGAVANVTVGEGPGLFPGIGFVGAGGRALQRRNVDAVVSRGIEVDASTWLGPVELMGSLSIADARVRGSGPAAGLDGRRPAQVPVWQGTLGATLDAYPWRLAARLSAEGARFDDDANSRRLGAYASVGASVERALNDSLVLRLAVDNITDATGPVAVNGLGVRERIAPRTVSVGLVMRR